MKLVAGGRRDEALPTDELYQAPLEQFTAARDALAARLKAAGDKDGAAAAKGLRKPSVPAWAANQVVWQARIEWERLRRATDALRRLQEQAASADERRQAGREQREALQACEARASELIAEHGHAAGPALLQKVGHTLLALAHGTSEARPGRVERELQPPGFEALAGLTLAAPPLPPPPPAAAPAADVAPKPVSSPAPRPAPVAARPVLVAAPSEPASPRASAVPSAAAAPAESQAESEERERRRVARVRAQGRVTEAERVAEQAKKRLAAEEGGIEALERRLEEARRSREAAREAATAAQAEAAAARDALQALPE